MVRNMMCMEYANLSNENAEKLRAIEKEMGVTLLAYDIPVYSPLKDEELKKIKDLENDLGISLVAYQI